MQEGEAAGGGGVGFGGGEDSGDGFGGVTVADSRTAGSEIESLREALRAAEAVSNLQQYSRNATIILRMSCVFKAPVR